MNLPDDVLLEVAGALPPLSRAALSCATIHLSHLLAAPSVWAASAEHLGIQYPSASLSGIKGLVALVCAAAALEELLVATEVAPGIHWIYPASAEGAAVVRRLRELEPHGVVSLAEPTGELTQEGERESRAAPPSLALVVCDAVPGSGWAPALSLASGRAPRYLDDNDMSCPCARPGCFNLAVASHRHCSKHSGADATRYVAMCAERLTCLPWPDGPRRFIFAAPNSACREAYRRAGLALGREQQRSNRAAVAPSAAAVTPPVGPPAGRESGAVRAAQPAASLWERARS